MRELELCRKEDNELTLQENFVDTRFVFSQLLQCSKREARMRLPVRYAKHYHCLPLALHSSGEGEFLTVLLPETPSEAVLKELQFICDSALVASTCELEILRQAIIVLYAQDECYVGLSSTEVRGAGNTPSQSTELAPLLRSSDGISRTFRALVLHAVSLRCSDIHLNCEARSAAIRFRLQGVLTELEGYSLDYDALVKLARHIKVCADLDFTDVGAPQEGAFLLEGVDALVRLRVSCLPTARGEKIVLRLLHNGCLEELSFKPFAAQLQGLGVFSEQQVLIERFLRAERGSLLVSGPTGSGKSTLLYVLLQQLCTPERNVVTIEDPVEAELALASQVDVSKLSISFTEALSKLLRQDPDVMLVGEIRTKDAAHTTLQAALTGTKVLASIHAGSCFEAIMRLMELGLSSELLGLAVHTLSAQRLVPKNCLNCRQTSKADAHNELLFQLPAGSYLSRSSGCTHCIHAGRVAVFEFLSLSAELKSILRAPQGDLMKAFASQAYAEGYQGYGYYLRKLVMQQVISPEAARVVLGV